LSWGVEEYHRGLEQFTGVEWCQVRAERGQRNHIGCALRAFVRLEYHRFTTGVSWFAAQAGIIRDAVRAYLAHPRLTLPGATVQPVTSVRAAGGAGLCTSCVLCGGDDPRQFFKEPRLGKARRNYSEEWSIGGEGLPDSTAIEKEVMRSLVRTG
jgi:hypothetical protein